MVIEKIGRAAKESEIGRVGIDPSCYELNEESGATVEQRWSKASYIHDFRQIEKSSTTNTHLLSLCSSIHVPHTKAQMQDSATHVAYAVSTAQ